ncbi:SDR family oxidoreductase [Nocardioides sp. TRM66260-LWL]|uniref:SDR family oxidoreductase n=1 Tax=Nocardioides sp. TRM66260-LWL TaxID=2874478 RepID=UPI001CC4E837|nr:SDR family oxidoreductase [Nocardioides sp. TRM66260-LWL]MBZ5735480.1 SDR family oxidoreductase [Nocardioides sp. TRM66260-LWL]
MTTDLTGQLVVITGAGRGIGLATAARFVDAGARVVIGDLDDDVAAKAALQVSRGRAGVAEGHVVDVADRASYAAFLDFARTLGPIDVLVNNAGIMPLSLLEQHADESIDKTLDVNVRGVITGTKLVVPDMIARRRGHVINVASAVGRMGYAGAAVYSASKFAVVGFTEAMYAELAPYGVHASVVLPTVVATELSAGVGNAPGMKPCTPEQVADTILAVARKPRLESWVPGYAQGVGTAVNLLPRSARDWLGRVTKGDQILLDVDAAARAEYERRASR